jgi:hypothetical protein
MAKSRHRIHDPRHFRIQFLDFSQILKFPDFSRPGFFSIFLISLFVRTLCYAVHNVRFGRHHKNTKISTLKQTMAVNVALEGSTDKYILSNSQWLSGSLCTFITPVGHWNWIEKLQFLECDIAKQHSIDTPTSLLLKQCVFTRKYRVIVTPMWFFSCQGGKQLMLYKCTYFNKYNTYVA